MVDDVSELHLFGDDFEAIMDILEEDEEFEKQCEAAVSDVSSKKDYPRSLDLFARYNM